MNKLYKEDLGMGKAIKTIFAVIGVITTLFVLFLGIVIAIDSDPFDAEDCDLGYYD